ncbi:hypothetical protein J7T55_000392 [Diaporthe amygdali]|uniref:uncharacterized protein n=1 Tax=Phomopsis amygdali TaxID=1214568 RepID=UPI0022FF27B5|nr:uncharacterized protein J7T55_000392 [Diaporthe amygdali]KAJ0109467.1 hypothetical protein J7T55_000392 [Diaporthe amygdali]
MDPLSISVSVLAVMGAAGFVVKTVKAIDHAPHELTDIADAAKALETTLDDVQHWQLAGHKLNEGLVFHLRRSEQKLLELARYLKDHGLTSPSKLRSPIYYVLYQEKLRNYKRQLSEIRNDLSLALSAVTHGQTGRIEMDLQQLIITRQATREALSEQTSQLDYLAQRSEEMGLARRRLCTPHSTRDWLGGLSVTFSEIGPLSSGCTVPSCARRLSPSASVDVTLPPWLASNIVSIWLKGAPVQGPELLLRSRRIIETPAYYTAEQGNLVALRQLYAEGRAGIHDSNPVSGRNTLFDGIFRGHLDIMRFLLDSGADMEAADFCGFTPRDLAFQRVNTACPPELAEHLRTLFTLDEVPDDLELTTVHRIVLGMTTLDLGEYLSEHPPEVNKPDLLGRTPLWWAVRRDDAPKSHALLARGADPNIANAAGRSPLHNAAAQRNLGLVDALLTHSADVHQRSFEGKTPLHVVGVYGIREDVLIVQRLLDSGAELARRTPEQVVDAMLAIADMSMIDPDAKDSRGKTASESFEERWSSDVPVYPLDEPTYEKLGRMIDKAARPRDTPRSPPWSAASTADSWHTARSPCYSNQFKD